MSNTYRDNTRARRKRRKVLKSMVAQKKAKFNEELRIEELKRNTYWKDVK